MADEPGSIFGLPAGGVTAGSAAIGGAADVYAFIRQEQQRRQMQQIYDILYNPTKLAAYVSKFNQPMSGAAVAATNRDLGANWAVQTGGAPGGAMNQYTADAFAKLETQRQNDATSAALKALLGAGGSIPNAPPMGNLGSIMQSLQLLRQLRGNNPPGATPPGIVYPGANAGPNADELSPEAQQGVFPAPVGGSAAP